MASSRPIRILYNGDVYEIYSDEVLFYEGNHTQIPISIAIDQVPHAVIDEYQQKWKAFQKRNKKNKSES